VKLMRKGNRLSRLIILLIPRNMKTGIL